MTRDSPVFKHPFYRIYVTAIALVEPNEHVCISEHRQRDRERERKSERERERNERERCAGFGVERGVFVLSSRIMCEYVCACKYERTRVLVRAMRAQARCSGGHPPERSGSHSRS